MSKFASVYFRQGRTRLDYAERCKPPGSVSTLRNVFVNIHPTHEARAASSSCRGKSLYININASSACTTYSCPLHSAGSPHRRKHESSTEFTAPTVNTNNLFAISVSRLSIFPFCATVSYVASPTSFG